MGRKKVKGPCKRCNAPEERYYAIGLCGSCYYKEIKKPQYEANKQSQMEIQFELKSQKRPPEKPLPSPCSKLKQLNIQRAQLESVEKLTLVKTPTPSILTTKTAVTPTVTTSAKTGNKEKSVPFKYSNAHLELLTTLQVQHHVSSRQAGPAIVSVDKSGFFPPRDTPTLSASKETSTIALIANGIACDYMIAMFMAQTPG